MPFIQTHDLNIHYEVAGTGDTVLVLAHGNFASWRWWRPVLDRLPAGVRAYAPDLRGCGDTDRPPDGYTVERLAGDLHAFARALRLPRFHLVGHSLGSAAALQSALDHPGPVQTLTLVAPAPAEGLPFSHDGTRVPWVACLFETSLDTLDAVYRLLRTVDANRPLLRQALIQLTPTLPHGDEFEALVDDAGRMAPEAVVGYLRALDAWNVQGELGRLHQPTLILGGGRDVLVPWAALERMAEGIAESRLVVWPDVGHSPQLEQPDRFVQLLMAFVEEHAGRRWLGDLWNQASARILGPSRKLSGAVEP